MEEDKRSPQEIAADGHLSKAQAQIGQLEAQIKNLGPEKGPQLKPSGGPTTTISNAQQKAQWEKQIGQIKEDTIKNVDRELEGADKEVIDKYKYKTDKELNSDQPTREEEKNIDRSQRYAFGTRYEHKQAKENPEQPLKDSDKKTLEQSQDHAFNKRYGKEQTAENKETADEKKPQAKDQKDLDASQEYAHSKRYRDKENEPDKAETPDASDSKDAGASDKGDNPQGKTDALDKADSREAPEPDKGDDD